MGVDFLSCRPTKGLALPWLSLLLAPAVGSSRVNAQLVYYVDVAVDWPGPRPPLPPLRLFLFDDSTLIKSQHL